MSDADEFTRQLLGLACGLALLTPSMQDRMYAECRAFEAHGVSKAKPLIYSTALCLISTPLNKDMRDHLQKRWASLSVEFHSKWCPECNKTRSPVT